MEVLAGVVAASAPLIYAVVGETITEKAGVVNLSLDGSILLSAMTGFATAATTNSLLIGFVAAMAVSMVIAGVVRSQASRYASTRSRSGSCSFSSQSSWLCSSVTLSSDATDRRCRRGISPPPLRHPGAGTSLLLAQRVGVRKLRGGRRCGCVPVSHPADSISAQWVSAPRRRMLAGFRSTRIATSPPWSEAPLWGSQVQQYLSIRLRDGGRTLR